MLLPFAVEARDAGRREIDILYVLERGEAVDMMTLALSTGIIDLGGDATTGTEWDPNGIFDKAMFMSFIDEVEDELEEQAGGAGGVLNTGLVWFASDPAIMGEVIDNWGDACVDVLAASGRKWPAGSAYTQIANDVVEILAEAGLMVDPSDLPSGASELDLNNAEIRAILARAEADVTDAKGNGVMSLLDADGIYWDKLSGLGGPPIDDVPEEVDFVPLDTNGHFGLGIELPEGEDGLPRTAPSASAGSPADYNSPAYVPPGARVEEDGGGPLFSATVLNDLAACYKFLGRYFSYSDIDRIANALSYVRSRSPEERKAGLEMAR